MDECDKMLEELDMRRDVQEIFKNTPNQKQVLMFSATLSVDIRPLCKKFMQDVCFFFLLILSILSHNLINFFLFHLISLLKFMLMKLN